MLSEYGRTSNEVNLSKLKSSYDALLPKYGFLWRSMANKQMKQKADDNAKVTSFIDAIETKRPISLNIHDCDDECDCADPIIEIDEDDSAYDEGELVDSDDENGDGTVAATDKLVDTGNDMKENTDERVEIVADITALDDSDNEIIMTGKKTKRKTFVIESDDESDLSKQEDLISLSDETIGSEENKRNVANADKPVQSVNATKSLHVGNESSDDVSTVSEKEWVELSSDEEDEAPIVRVNTVVILSSDEEESEDEIDANSVFSIGSSDSDDDTIPSELEGNCIPKGRHSSNVTTGKKIKGPLSSKKVAKANETSRTKTATSTSMSQQSSKSSSWAFKKKRDSITSSTFSTFNQLAFRNALSSVEVTWSNKLNTTAGLTRMKGKLGQPESRVATIELATKVIDNEERLRSTLLHEMCHAAAWLVDGVHKPPHGKCFKKWAAVSMKHVADVEVTTTHDYQIAYKYAWACLSKSCSVVIKRHSRSVDPNKHCCGRCKSKLIEIEVPDRNTDSSTYTPKKRKTSAYALFVKEQMPHVRHRLANERGCRSNEVPQADVMKECGRLWRSKKESGANNDSTDDGFEIMASRLDGLSLNNSSPGNQARAW